MRFLFLFIGINMLLYSCVNKIEEVNRVTQKYDLTKDIADSVRIVYSDSGLVKLILEAPMMERYDVNHENKDVFPKGIFVSFMNENQVADSWLKADYATRMPKENKMIVKGNVSFYNAINDKLQSSELIWDDKNKTIYTEKFIRITRPSIGDTIYGIGFITDQNFKRIEIKKQVKAKLAGKEFKQAF